MPFQHYFSYTMEASALTSAFLQFYLQVHIFCLTHSHTMTPFSYCHGYKNNQDIISFINSFSSNKIVGQSKLKAFADGKMNGTQN